MEPINSISSIIFDVMARLYEGLSFDGGSIFSLARMDQYIDGSRVPSNIRAVLSQISFALSLVFAAIFVVTKFKRAAIGSPSSPTPEIIVDQAVTMENPGMSGVFRGRWNEILTHLDSARENDWKSAVMNADKLVDTALVQSGYSGETFGDRLTNIEPGALLSLDGLWWAHKVRNRLAHEVDYFLRYTEARAAISYYEATLSELKLI